MPLSCARALGDLASGGDETLAASLLVVEKTYLLTTMLGQGKALARLGQASNLGRDSQRLDQRQENRGEIQ